MRSVHAPRSVGAHLEILRALALLVTIGDLDFAVRLHMGKGGDVGGMPIG